MMLPRTKARGAVPSFSVSTATELLLLGAQGKKKSVPRRRGLNLNKRKKGYNRELPRKMYSYFAGYDDPKGLPSFSKFARLSGVTLEELTGFRKNKEFERAWRECVEIKRDYLIDMAITKRADASFAKFLLSDADDSDDGSLNFTLTVID